jgi:hypothetical protein
MELTIFFDKGLTNRQVIRSQRKVEAKPIDIVRTICPNWYGFQVGEGKIIINPSKRE